PEARPLTTLLDAVCARPHRHTLSLHDALPISNSARAPQNFTTRRPYRGVNVFLTLAAGYDCPFWATYRQIAERGGQVKKGERGRSEEHTSELQSRENLVCRLLLEKKKIAECSD